MQPSLPVLQIRANQKGGKRSLTKQGMSVRNLPSQRMPKQSISLADPASRSPRWARKTTRRSDSPRRPKEARQPLSIGRALGMTLGKTMLGSLGRHLG